MSYVRAIIRRNLWQLLDNGCETVQSGESSESPTALGCLPCEWSYDHLSWCAPRRLLLVRDRSRAQSDGSRGRVV